MAHRFYRTNFIYVANRYEEWQAGRCISNGSISTRIVAEVEGDTIHFELDDIGKIRMLKSFDFEIYGEDFCVLPDRIQYTYGTNDFNPIVPMICHIFSDGSTINYVRFAMTNPDRIVEFYGTLAQCGQPSTGHKAETKSDTPITAEKTIQELRSYGMYNAGAVVERAVKLFNDNACVSDKKQAKAILESLKLFVKALELDRIENGKISLLTPKLLMYIAFCNFKIGNINHAYCIAKQGVDAIDEALDKSSFSFPRSMLGADKLEELITAIENNHSDFLDSDNSYADKDPFEIDSSIIDRFITNQTVSKEDIENMIETISRVQELFDKAAERTGDVERGLQMRHGLEQFKFPLYFAWQGYKYGWHTDWCKEGDSLLPFMLFEADAKKYTQSLLDQLRSESPFACIERNSAITDCLIAIYTAFICDIDNGTIKI